MCQICAKTAKKMSEKRNQHADNQPMSNHTSAGV